MKDFIGIYDNALSSEQCKQVIEYFESFDVYALFQYALYTLCHVALIIYQS